jgi:hypothetical protein
MRTKSHIRRRSRGNEKAGLSNSPNLPELTVLAAFQALLEVYIDLPEIVEKTWQ